MAWWWLSSLCHDADQFLQPMRVTRIYFNIIMTRRPKHTTGTDTGVQYNCVRGFEATPTNHQSVAINLFSMIDASFADRYTGVDRGGAGRDDVRLTSCSAPPLWLQNRVPSVSVTALWSCPLPADIQRSCFIHRWSVTMARARARIDQQVPCSRHRAAFALDRSRFLKFTAAFVEWFPSALFLRFVL